MSSTILDAWYGALRSGNLEAIRDVATADIRVWWNGPADLVPWAGEHIGADAVIAFFTKVTGHLNVLRTTVVERMDTPEATVIFLDAHWQVKANGQEIRAKAINVFRFQGGKVSGYEVYPDSAA
ncbi:MAG: nuclear transport factor 2 family protein, partial [Beijerinckiaceae bacterium]